MKRLLPLYVRMWLHFLFLRKRVFTEKDMNEKELEELAEYVRRKYSLNMYLSFGYVNFDGKTVEDTYDFAPVKSDSLLSLLINFSCLYHRMGYKGYKVVIKLH
jgi:hypothetical protein